MHKKLLLLIAAVLACLLVAGCASAASASLSDIYVQPASDDPETVSPHAVYFFQKNTTDAYLFLPAGMDPSSLRVFCGDVKEFIVDGVTMVSGEETGLFGRLLGQTVPIRAAGKKLDLTIMQSENLPALFLTTESGSLDYVETKKGNKETGAMTVLETDGSTSYTGSLAHIKMHGNGTLTYGKKKPYEIKLEEKASLLGMAKDKTWILLANVRDNSLIRNKIALDMALEVGIGYSVHSAFVDVYINNRYRGNYTLTEKVEVGKNRVAITDLGDATEALNDQPLNSYARYGKVDYKFNTQKAYQIPNDPEDITGGYLMEFELSYRYTSASSGFVTRHGQSVVMKTPKHASAAQILYISGLMQELEEAVFSEDGINPTTGKHYYEYADKDSLALLCVLEEVVKNYDGNRSSLYFYKPADSESTLVYAGPGWDFDQIMDAGGRKIQLGSRKAIITNSTTSSNWFPKLYQISDFRQRVQELYTEKFVPCLAILLGEQEDGTYLKSVQSYKDQISASAAMNFARWGYVNMTEARRVGSTFDKAISYIQTFMTERREWLDSMWLIHGQE